MSACHEVPSFYGTHCVLGGLSFKTSVQVISEFLEPIGLEVFWDGAV